MTYRTPWLFTWKLIANLNCSIPIFWPSKSNRNFKQVIDQISHSYGVYSNGRALQPFLLTTMLPIKHNWVKLTWFYSVAKANLKDTIKISPVQFFFFFCLGFLSRTFTNYRNTGKGGGHFFNSSPPLPPASLTLRH